MDNLLYQWDDFPYGSLSIPLAELQGHRIELIEQHADLDLTDLPPLGPQLETLSIWQTIHGDLIAVRQRHL